MLQRPPTQNETAAGATLLTDLQDQEQLSPDDVVRYFCLTVLNRSESILVD